MSLEVIKCALTLAHKNDLITLLHVIDTSTLVPPAGPPDWPAIMSAARRRAEHFFQNAQSANPIARLQLVTLEGRAHQEILNYAARQPVDLIVLGLKPHNRLQWFRRHTASRVQSASSRPVVLAPILNGPQPTESIELAFDEGIAKFAKGI